MLASHEVWSLCTLAQRFQTSAPDFVIAARARHHQSGVKALTRAGLVVLGALLGLSRPAFAQGTDRVTLVYEAAAGCPSEADFEAAVEARGGHFAGHSAPGSAQALRVAIRAQDTGFLGTLQATNEDATSALREVHGATCREVLDALAVVSASALNHRTESPSAEPTPDSTPAEKAQAAPASAAEGQGRLRATGHVLNARIPVSAGTLRFDKARAVTLFAGAQSGVLPNQLVPRFGLSLTSASFVTTPEGKSLLDGVIPRLHMSYLGPATYHTVDASAEVQGFMVGLGVCWSPIYDTRGLIAVLCGEYGAGVMRIKSKDAAGEVTRDKNAGLGFAGLGVESQYNLGALLHLGLKLGVDFMADTFGAERPDGSAIFQSSGVMGYGMLGIGLHF